MRILEPTMTMVRATVTLPTSLLAEVDRLAGRGGRSSFVADAITDKVRRERLRRVLEETRGALSASSSWSTADRAYEWVRDMREDHAE
jgi:metal-responsive CopG/Arc/MetJ family transcriptional regulator